MIYIFKYLKYLAYFFSSLFFGIMGILILYYRKLSFKIEDLDFLIFCVFLFLVLLYIILNRMKKISNKFLIFNFSSFFFGLFLILFSFLLKN